MCNMRLLITAILIANVSCSSSPTEPGPAGGGVTLRFGQAATVAGTRISFTDITDSRCPKDVTCAWAGDAAVRLESGSESVVLHSNPGVGASSATLAGVTVTLVEVTPDPVSTVETKKTDYRATIRVVSQ